MIKGIDGQMKACRCLWLPHKYTRGAVNSWTVLMRRSRRIWECTEYNKSRSVNIQIVVTVEITVSMTLARLDIVEVAGSLAP